MKVQGRIELKHIDLRQLKAWSREHLADSPLSQAIECCSDEVAFETFVELAKVWLRLASWVKS